VGLVHSRGESFVYHRCARFVHCGGERWVLSTVEVRGFFPPWTKEVGFVHSRGESFVHRRRARFVHHGDER